MIVLSISLSAPYLATPHLSLHRIGSKHIPSYFVLGIVFVLLLRKTPPKIPSNEDCATSYRLKWGPLPPNEVGRITQNVREREREREEREGEGRKEKGWGGSFCVYQVRHDSTFEGNRIGSGNMVFTAI